MSDGSFLSPNVFFTLQWSILRVQKPVPPPWPSLTFFLKVSMGAFRHLLWWCRDTIGQSLLGSCDLKVHGDGERVDTRDRWYTLIAANSCM